MQTPQITHEEYCRIIGELYIDANLRIHHLEKQSSGTTPLPLIQSLQQQIAKLTTENGVLSGNLNTAQEELAVLREKLS
jgi:hypothetical protein